MMSWVSIFSVEYGFEKRKRARLSAIHFQGRFIRQVSCYTLLSGFRLPWPPSCCLNEPTPFAISGMSVRSGTLTRRSVDPASPVLLTKNGPLRTCSIRFVIYSWLPAFNTGHQDILSQSSHINTPVTVHLKQLWFLTHLKFENRLKLFQLQGL